jgi:peptidoglycan hydrolase CwlO-like protein
MTQSHEPEDRLDRLEKIVESNAKAILALTNQGVELNNKIDRVVEQSAELNHKLDRLANIILKVVNRQDDHEDRINRLEE